LLALWYYKNSSSAALVTVGMVMGWIAASFAFATPLGDVAMWKNSFNFIMCFLCVALVFPVFLLMKPKFLHVLSTSIVGSYLFMFGLDYFLGSGLDDIVFNVFKRMTSQTFSQNYAGNFFGKDFNGCTDASLNLGMTAAWLLLTLTSVAMQYKVTANGMKYPKSSHPNYTQRYAPRRFGQVEEDHSLSEYSREERRQLNRTSSDNNMRAFARTVAPSSASDVQTTARAAARKEQRLKVELICSTREQERNQRSTKKKKKPLFQTGAVDSLDAEDFDDDAPLLGSVNSGGGSKKASKKKKGGAL